MPRSRTEIQHFNQQWASAFNWAKDNNIPYPVYNQAYKLGLNDFLTSGNTWSTDDIQAMLSAAAEGQPLTQEGTHWQDVPSNVVGDLRSMLSGLVHIPSELTRQIQEVYHDPSWLNPFYAPGLPSEGMSPSAIPFAAHNWAYYWKARANNPLYSLIPGWTDVLTAMSGTSGLKDLAAHPLFTLLDAPLPDGGSVVERFASLARDSGHEALADALTKTAQISKRGTFGNAADLIGRIPVPFAPRVPKGIFDDSLDSFKAGSSFNDVLERPRIHHYFLRLERSLGISPRVRGVSRIINEQQQKILDEYPDLIHNLQKTHAHLTAEERRQVHNALTLGTGPPDDPRLAAAYKASAELVPILAERNEKMGEILRVPYGDTFEYFPRDSEVGKAWIKLQKNREKLLAAQEAQSAQKALLSQLSAQEMYERGPSGRRRMTPLASQTKASIRNLDKRIKSIQDRVTTLDSFIQSRPEMPARFRPLVNAAIAPHLINYLRGLTTALDPELLKNALSELENDEINGISFQRLMASDPLFRREFKRIRDEVESNWQAFQEAGLNPIYVPNITTDAVRNASRLPHVIPTQARRPDASWRRMRNSSTSVHDAAVSLTHYAKQTIERQAALEVYHQITTAYGVHAQDIEARAEQMYRIKSKYLRSDPIISRSSHIHDIIRKELRFSAWDQETISSIFPFRSALKASDFAKGRIFIPSDIVRALRMLGSEPHPFLSMTVDPITRLFKTSILSFSPRFNFHIIFGGLTLMALRTGPSILPDFFRAFRAIHEEGAKALPYRMSRHAAEINTPDFLANMMIGKKYRQLAWESHLASNPALRAAKIPLDIITGYARWSMKMTDWISNAYHLATYYYGLRKFESEEQALNLTHKVFADLNAMTPMEVQVISRIFPFWGWMKHVIRYIATYPVDHPFRAEILSSLAYQWLQTWNTGVPGHMALLFDIGNPDPVTGNFETFDFRQLNPFRDSWNYATFVGWEMSLNPLALGLLSASGVDTMAASPQMYPALHFDAFYGSTSPYISPGQRVMSFSEAIAPQTGILDAMFNISYTLKSLRQYSPQAYRKQLFSMLNLPEMFSGNTGPLHLFQRQNIYQIEEQYQLKMWEDLKSQVTTALQTGDFSPIINYNYVPYGGEMITPQGLEMLAAQTEQMNLTTGNPYIPPGALMQKPVARW